LFLQDNSKRIKFPKIEAVKNFWKESLNGSKSETTVMLLKNLFRITIKKLLSFYREPVKMILKVQEVAQD